MCNDCVSKLKVDDTSCDEDVQQFHSDYKQVNNVFQLVYNLFRVLLVRNIFCSLSEMM